MVLILKWLCISEENGETQACGKVETMLVMTRVMGKGGWQRSSGTESVSGTPMGDVKRLSGKVE